jgi:hypothetical protein
VRRLTVFRSGRFPLCFSRACFSKSAPSLSYTWNLTDKTPPVSSSSSSSSSSSAVLLLPGEDGTVDVSPSARFCVSEAQIIGNLYNGLQAMMEAENAAVAGGEATEAPAVADAEPAAEG